MLFGKYRKEKAFENCMVWFRRVQISAGPVAAGECGGGHESAVENVFLFNLGVVEDGLKADGVKKTDDTRVSGHKRARRHVASQNCRFVFLHPGFEVFDFAFAVVVA